MSGPRPFEIVLSQEALDLLERARQEGGRIDTSGLRGGHVVELLTAGLVDVQRGVMIVTEVGVGRS